MIRKTKMNKLFVLSTLFLFILSGCSDKEVYSGFHSFKNAKWDKNDLCRFEIQITDTINPKDIFIETRNNNEYPYQNIWLFVKIETPTGNSRQDTLNCELADNFGKWRGEGINLYEMNFLYEKSIVFSQKGIYTFTIQQGMRDDVLTGISDVGIKLTPSFDAKNTK